MSPGALFALLSLLFAGVNDVVFKRYARKTRSRGVYVLGMGIVWTALQILTFNLRDLTLALDGTTLAFGLAAGVFVTLANIFLIESLTRVDVSLGSTIYRLNTIGVVALSVVLLDESLGPMKSLGIAFGIAGVVLLYQRQGRRRDGNVLVLFFGLALLASALRAAYGVTTRAGILQQADPDTMLLLIAPSWILGGLCYAIFREKRLRLTKKKALYSVGSGVLVFLIANFLMLAVTYGEASVVIPIANLSFIVALLLSVGLKMETLDWRKICAVGCAAASIALLAQA